MVNHNSEIELMNDRNARKEEAEMDKILRSLGDLFTLQTRRIRRVEEALRKSQEEIGKLSGQVAELERTRGQHGRKIDHLLAESSLRRSDVTTERDNRHYEVAMHYQDFRDQKIRVAAAQVLASGDGRPLDHRRLANVTAQLCRALFGTNEPDSGEVLRALGRSNPADQVVTTLLATATELRRESAQADGAPFWDFEATPGGLVGADFQETWLDAPPDGLLQFVVTPAYRARDRLYCKQQVWTETRNPSPYTVGLTHVGLTSANRL